MFNVSLATKSFIISEIISIPRAVQKTKSETCEETEERRKNVSWTTVRCSSSQVRWVHDKEEKERILHASHSDKLAGHFGRDKTREKVP